MHRQLYAMLLTVCGLLLSCRAPSVPAPRSSEERPQSASDAPALEGTRKVAAEDALEIRFGRFSEIEGLTVSIATRGDADGETTFANRVCCGIRDAQQFVRDVRVLSEGRALAARRGPTGWTVSHRSGAPLTITYRLPPSGPITIDAGPLDQIRPIVHDGAFHLMGNPALLLPEGRDEDDMVDLTIDATQAAKPDRFVSSFGPGHRLRVTVPRSHVRKALYLGGAIDASVVETPSGRIGVAFGGLGPDVDRRALREDASAILAHVRAFFGDTQPWYLVSVRGGERRNPGIHIGGGMGLTDSFAMFVRSDFPAGELEPREQFRWVLAHEYVHEWIGLTVRVAPLPESDRDDVASYWFSEGVTEFYAMRLLARAGLQSPERSLDMLNHKLARYLSNPRRNLDAATAGERFWTDADAEQIPYLRGYLAAWYLDRRLESSIGDGLDARVKALVDRARREPTLRVDSEFLLPFLGRGLAPRDVQRLRRFVVDGGDPPLDADIFAPCMTIDTAGGKGLLQYRFANQRDVRCFIH